jgi:glutamate/tyrosine decarboxylase-like PLP-dependent enzyme
MCQQAVQRIQLYTRRPVMRTPSVVAVMRLTFDGSDEPVAEMATGLDRLQERTGWDIPRHVDGASGR